MVNSGTETVQTAPTNWRHLRKSINCCACVCYVHGYNQTTFNYDCWLAEKHDRCIFLFTIEFDSKLNSVTSVPNLYKSAASEKCTRLPIINRIGHLISALIEWYLPNGKPVKSWNRRKIATNSYCSQRHESPLQILNEYRLYCWASGIGHIEFKK